MRLLAEYSVKGFLLASVISSPAGFFATGLCAQAAAGTAVPASGATRLVGTVRSISGSTMTVAKDNGSTATVMLGGTVRVQQLPAGSTDIKAAQDATASDIAEGDRVLVAARPADTGALSATRIVLMKSGAIAQSNASRQADWQRRGSGGIVTAVDSAAKSLTIAAGTKKTSIQTSDKTVFRRYAPGSVRFEDAKIGNLTDIGVGDQLRVRGSRDVDTNSISAEEIVSGSFRNVAGTINAVDAVAGTLTLRDLATRKNVIVAISAESDLRNLPPEMAARFVARSRPAGASGASGGASGAVAGRPASGGVTGSAGTSAGEPSRPTAGALPSTPATGEVSGRGRSGAGNATGDLSQVLPRLPKTTLAALKPGEAVMVVASGNSASGASLTAITLLSGVEPLLAASPDGASSFNLSPWSLGGGGDAGATGGTQ